MLRLLVENNDIVKISKVLGKYKIKASITNSTIIIESNEVPDEVVEVIINNTKIIKAQNYKSEEPDKSEDIKVSEEVSENQEEEHVTVIENQDDDEEISEEILENADIPIGINNTVTNTSKGKPQNVYRGDAYKWGVSKNGIDAEGSVKECVIILQNDYENSTSEETIALFCTTNYSERCILWNTFQFIKGNMADYSRNRLSEWWNQTTFFISHIIGVKKDELGPYIGAMNPTFMNSIQPAIDFCLGLKRSRTVNMNQLKILATVNMEDLFKISESKVRDKEKVDEFLKLFGFDLSCKGMDYLEEAILIAPKLGDYRLEELANEIAKNHEVESKDVLKTIIARVKEKFNFKKSPAISFIRLIERLVKG